jgi:hypothetical protein
LGIEREADSSENRNIELWSAIAGLRMIPNRALSFGWIGRISNLPCLGLMETQADLAKQRLYRGVLLGFGH